MLRFRMMFILIIVFTTLMVFTLVGAEQPEEKISGSMLRIGTFDSRAIAIAYYNSEAHSDYIKNLKAERDKAKEAGDEERVKELNEEGEASQELAHKQGFSTYPVDNILETIKEKIPDIAKKANVDVIVSKWDIVYQRPGVEFIDVTAELVKIINPDEKMLKLLEEIKKQDPVSLEELEKQKD